MAGSVSSSDDITVKQAASLPRGRARKTVLQEAMRRKRDAVQNAKGLKKYGDVKVDYGYGKVQKGGAFDTAQEKLYKAMAADKKRREAEMARYRDKTNPIPKSPTN